MSKITDNEAFVRAVQRWLGVDEDGWGGVTTMSAFLERTGQTPPTAEVAGVQLDPQLVADLKRDEGVRLTAYPDTVGVWTIGYGHTGPEVKPGLRWTEAQAEAALRKDILDHNAGLAQALPWVAQLDPVRRRVLQNMAFNLGIKRLLGFKNTLAMVQSGRYEDAAANMLKSKWAGQVGNRAKRLAEQMRTGR